MHDETRSAPINLLLNALSEEDHARLTPMLEHVELPNGMIVAHPDETIAHVYFPETAMLSIVAYTDTGQAAEVAVIGSEGATGLAVVMGADATPYENMVQVPGTALRMKTEDVRREFDESKPFRDILLRFSHKWIVQASQTALCNRIHSVEQRLAKWLLTCHDRVAGDTLPLTQEFLAIMLGSSRTSVTLTAIELQKHGFISYERGLIQIRDREGLENVTCACYHVVSEVYGQPS
jgi:CRP-like cAMP-binding protein